MKGHFESRIMKLEGNSAVPETVLSRILKEIDGKTRGLPEPVLLTPDDTTDFEKLLQWAANTPCNE